MTYLESIMKVLVVGLILGAGLPALFATGLLAFAGRPVARNPMMKFLGLALFVFVGAVILVAILWITRGTIIHHTGVDLFPFLPRK